MASSSELAKGARRRTTASQRVRVIDGDATAGGHVLNPNNDGRSSGNLEDAKDSGLSSESSTPTGGSPPPRQPRNTGTAVALSNSVLPPRGKQPDGPRYISLDLEYDLF